MPEDRGRLVNAFLTSFFDRYIQPSFTAELEDRLDDVAGGDLFWKDVLRDFWAPFALTLGEVGELRVAQVIDALNERLAFRLFPPRPDAGDPRVCPTCGNGQLSLKLGRYGAFVGCSNYPECRYTRQLGDDPDAKPAETERRLGADPATGEPVWLKTGRFGPYVQRGEGEETKRCSLPPGQPVDEVDLDLALRLLALPREVTPDRETGEPILAGIGRYGPYVQRGRQYVNLPADENVLTISDNRAIALLAEASEGGRRGRSKAPAAGPLRDLGKHPKDGEPVHILAGRFGPYVKHGKLNASLPKSRAPEDLLDGGGHGPPRQACRGRRREGQACCPRPRQGGTGQGSTREEARGQGQARSAQARQPQRGRVSRPCPGAARPLPCRPGRMWSASSRVPAAA